MSPIYVRPAREQSEHDRLIRHLQLKYKRKHEVAVNIDGVEPSTPVKIGQLTLYPDLVLTAGKKLAGLIEIETGESVNNLETMAQWVHFAKARVPFHLYVPVHGYEAARRLCDAYKVKAGEIWTYRPVNDGFDLVRMHADPSGVLAPAPPPKPEPTPAKAAPPNGKSLAPANGKTLAPATGKPQNLPAVKGAASPSKPVAPAPKAVPSKPAAPAVKAQPAAPKPAPANRKPAPKVGKPASKPPAKAVKAPAKKAAKAAPKPASKAKAPAGKAKKAPARRGR